MFAFFLCESSSSFGLDSVVVRPLVLREEGVHHLLHGVVWDELVLRQLGPRDRVEMPDPVQVLLDVLAVVGDA